MAGVGISESFVARVREQVTPGSSALFVLCAHSVLGRVVDEVRGPELIAEHLPLSSAVDLLATHDHDCP